MNIKNRKEILKEIDEFCKELKMPFTRKNIDEIIKDSICRDIGYENFLHNILENELDLRKENGKQSRIRLASFPQKKYLEDLVIEQLPEDAQSKVKVFSTLDFIQSGQNIILAGNPGTGKTHIAVGLGIKACIEGYKVLFTTVPLLVNQLKESRSQRTLRAFENKFEKYDLVIADELGYISFDKEGSELLFTYLSLRAGRKSTIITTNLSFERWDEIFKDPVMTAAMIDRLTHKSYIVNMNGNSYRLKETQEWMESQA
ncbi:MAG: IS21-like element helper ATPase IstB [Paraclostridium sp.]